MRYAVGELVTVGNDAFAVKSRRIIRTARGPVEYYSFVWPGGQWFGLTAQEIALNASVH